jgi:hypothetical protein
MQTPTYKRTLVRSTQIYCAKTDYKMSVKLNQGAINILGTPFSTMDIFGLYFLTQEMCVKVSNKTLVKSNSDVWQDLKLVDRYRGKRSHRFDQCLIWSLECQF